MKETIIGKTITLQRLSCDMETAETIFSVIDRCRETFSPWLGWVQQTHTADDSLKFLEMINNDWNTRKQFVYGLHLNHKFIGLISVLNIAWQHKRAEIGYWLDTAYTGKGYMSEAVKLIEKELFEDDFNRIVIYTDVLNIKSAKIPQTLGYIHEGILRQDTYSETNHRFRDRNIFSKLKSDVSTTF